jgi:outer membrane protein OmpA-like peptidoglycan-associated protein/tetratricopeptide (TPR) repeat protein
MATLASFLVDAQQLSTSNKKAIKLYDESRTLINLRQFDEAIGKLNLAVKKDPSFAEAYIRLAGIYKTLNEQDLASQYYQIVADMNPDSRRYSKVYLNLGSYHFGKGQYQPAKKYLELYLKYKTSEDRNWRNAETMLNNCNFSLANMSNGFEFNPQPLPEPINQWDMQYFPVLTADQKTLIFVVRNADEEIMVSKYSDNGWGKPGPISANISSEFNEGTCSISADGRVLVFTSCMGRPGFGSCDLFISTREGNIWSKPENMGKTINSSAWDSQPSLSADGRTLYFVSNRQGGLGKRDIWVATKKADNTWRNPVNLGPAINTIYDDISPFIHPNGQRLYFAANGRLGFGGFDIYFSERGKNEKWQTVTNFGYPINTHNDEVSMFISADGSKGYYSHEESSSERRISKLYTIDIPPALQVTHKSGFISGIVSDKDTGEPLNASIKLIDLENNKNIGWVTSDSLTGEYLMVLTEGAEYALYVESEGYLFNSFYFDFLIENDENQSIHANIQLSKIKPGVSTVLNNIFFEFDKFELTGKSATELQKVVEFLEHNNELNILISGYTDNVGTEQYNLVLSTKRAQSVYDFLTVAGIDSSKISYKGFGSEFPLHDNSTDEGRKLNRRIEFEIIE